MGAVARDEEPPTGEVDAYGSNCNVKLTAVHRQKPSSNANSHEGNIKACCAPLAVNATDSSIHIGQDAALDLKQ
jgi:hypothetical protein